MIDVICLTDTTSLKIYEMTHRTITSIRESETDYKFNIILLDTNPNSEYSYNNVDYYVIPNEPFNYNRYLNIASKYLKFDWVLITNDDVRYEKNWFSEILKIYNSDNTIESFSPKDMLFYSTIYGDHFLGSNDTHWVSYNVTEAVCGWSILMRKKVWDLIGKWDEEFDFYYQDNDYAKTIESLGIKHAIVRNSLTLHIGNLSFFNRKDDEHRENKMKEGYKKYLKKWGE
jgi:GT2 family glycosyltransferase